MTRRKLSQQEKRASERARLIWARKKKADPTFTQERLAELCGWSTQGAAYQYLSGIIPINMTALIRLSGALGVPPEDIYPELWDSVSSAPARRLILPVLSWEEITIRKRTGGGKMKEGQFERIMVDADSQLSDRAFCLKMETSSMNGIFPKGAKIIVDPALTAEIGEVVVAASDDDDPVIGVLQKQGSSFIVRPENKQFPATMIKKRDIIGVVTDAIVALRKR